MWVGVPSRYLSWVLALVGAVVAYGGRSEKQAETAYGLGRPSAIQCPRRCPESTPRPTRHMKLIDATRGGLPASIEPPPGLGWQSKQKDQRLATALLPFDHPAAPCPLPDRGPARVRVRTPSTVDLGAPAPSQRSHTAHAGRLWSHPRPPNSPHSFQQARQGSRGSSHQPRSERVAAAVVVSAGFDQQQQEPQPAAARSHGQKKAASGVGARVGGRRRPRSDGTGMGAAARRPAPPVPAGERDRRGGRTVSISFEP